MGICLECKALLGILSAEVGLVCPSLVCGCAAASQRETVMWELSRNVSSCQKRDAFGNSSVTSLIVEWVVEGHGAPVSGSSCWWKGTEEAV